jgi:hypothetical protein
MTLDAMDGRNMGIAKAVNLSMSFTFTSGSQREGPQKGKAWWFVRVRRTRRPKYDGT